MAAASNVAASGCADRTPAALVVTAFLEADATCYNNAFALLRKASLGGGQEASLPSKAHGCRK